MPLFLYGTLRYPPLLTLVAGSDVTLSPASVVDHAVRWADGECFPLLVTEPGAKVQGLLFDGGPEAQARMDYYEGAFGYVRQPLTVETEDGPVAAEVYAPPEDLWPVGGPWNLNDWATKWGAMTLRAAAEVMSRKGIDTAEQVGENFTQTRVRAVSWLRGQTESPAPVVRKGYSAANDAQTRARRMPYRHFFAVEEQEVAFRRFDGSIGAPVNRAAYVMGDAATVLPYDPVRDRVLMVEQFRFGPYVRGDTHPWSLEPIAGRVDPGEDPETAVLREAVEEAGLHIEKLEDIGRYYPSPGGVTEFLFSYVGIADLPDEAARIGGLDSEDEDIRGVILDFDAALALAGTGEAATGPLLLSLYWLAANRDRLRAGG